ncbi:MAG: hypothetical protein J6K45_04950 [Clostridia bacterium]|nr:hypothetical protein [Clostridia bacterium]
MDIQVGDRVTYKSDKSEKSERQVIMTNEEQIENYKKSNLILKKMMIFYILRNMIKK